VGAAEYLQSLKDRFRSLYVLSTNGRLLSKELLDEYFDLKAKIERFYNGSSVPRPDCFFKRIVKESRPWLATTKHN